MRAEAAKAGIPTARAAGIDLASIGRTAFRRLIDALHCSRHADAVRIIRNSQHLMHNYAQPNATGSPACAQPTEPDHMPTYFRLRSPQPSAPRRDARWILVALLCFGILHVIGGTILRYNTASLLVDRTGSIPDVGD
jgi:hypothetical protein